MNFEAVILSLLSQKPQKNVYYCVTEGLEHEYGIFRQLIGVLKKKDAPKDEAFFNRIF